MTKGVERPALSAVTHTTVDEITLLCLAMSAVIVNSPGWGFAAAINPRVCVRDTCESAGVRPQVGVCV